MSRKRKGDGSPRGRGRPEHEPTEENRALVERLAGLFVSHDEIAHTWLQPPIDTKTLRKYYRDQLDHGPARVGNSIKARILRAAENGSLRAMTYLADRLCPEFQPKLRVPENLGNNTAIMAGGTTIIIKGGPPDEPVLAKVNGAGNGSDHSAPEEPADL